MPYQVDIAASAKRQLKKLQRKDGEIYDAAREAILALEHDPFPTGSRRVRALEDGWRIRFKGTWRIVYIVDETGQTVTIHRVAQRKSVYDNL